jgi:hypothetical protein
MLPCLGSENNSETVGGVDELSFAALVNQLLLGGPIVNSTALRYFIFLLDRLCLLASPYIIQI